MTSKQTILKKLAEYQPSEQLEPLPTSGPWIHYDNKLEQFESLIAAVGGTTLRIENEQSLETACSELSHYQQAGKVCAIDLQLNKSNVDLTDIDDPHDLEDLDFLAIRGGVAVAENGAIWVSGEQLLHRVAPFITQHLAIVVQVNQIVHHMHEAYSLIELVRPGYGVFISGPSKTADIEQSLVIGAHGPRSLTVFVVGAS